MRYYLLALAGLLCSTAQAQTVPPAVQISNLFGGSGDDHARKIIQTSDKGYLMSGWTWSTDGQSPDAHGGTDGWVVKTDSLGQFKWAKSIGGTGYDVATTAAEGPHAYIVAGYAPSTDGDFLNMPGTTNRGWIAWVNKSNGNMIRLKPYAGSQFGNVNDVQVLANGNLFVTGTQTNAAPKLGNVWVALLDSTGTILWEKFYGRGSTSGYDNGVKAIQKKGGGFMVAGATSSTDGDVSGLHGNQQDVWLLNLDSAGNKLWAKCYGSTDDEMPVGIAQTSSGDFICGAITYGAAANGDISSVHGGTDYWIFKVTATGQLKWSKTYGGSQDDAPFDLAGTCDNGAIITGHSMSNDGDVLLRRGVQDIFLVRVDSTGSIAWKQTYGTTAQDYEAFITITKDNGYAMAATASTTGGDVSGTLHGTLGGDYWLAKFPSDGLKNICTNTGTAVAPLVAGSFTIYPNPANDAINIRLQSDEPINLFLYDAIGRVVFSKKYPAQKEIVLPVAAYPAGIYNMVLRSGDKQIFRKISIQH